MENDNNTPTTTNGANAVSSTIGYWPPAPLPQPCPSCGHCPTCGRDGHHAVPVYPVYPVYPWQPWQPWWQTTGAQPYVPSITWTTYGNG